MKQIFSVHLFVTLSSCWDLNHFGISDNYYISDIAIYRSKAFLTLPRSVCYNNVSNPTIVEVPWTGGYKQPSAGLKNSRIKILEYQTWTDCKDIQDAISLDIEPKKPKLWILDKGNEFCSPKILSYNIIYNSLSDIIELRNIPRQDLTIIKIDPQLDNFGYKMYIGNAGENTLLVFSSDSLKFKKLNLLVQSDSILPSFVNADFLAISKAEPVLYITGRSTFDIFSVNLKDIRNSDTPSFYETEKFSQEINATLIGQKMGLSTGLETDFRSGLSYYMVRDYVVVRWMIGLPIAAEYHTVLAQSYQQLPYVAKLFTGPQYGVWALVNPLSLEECNVVRMDTDEIPKVENRVVKILKYNKFLDDMFNH